MNLFQCIAALTAANQTVFDIGAFTGDMSSMMSQQVGPGGRVYAFECQPVHFAQLSLRAAAAPHRNIFPFLRAISDQVGHMTLHVDTTPTSQASTIVPQMASSERLGSKFPTLFVETDTIDHICSLHDLKPTFMKIDVEGAEGHVLRGAINTLRKCSPCMLLESTCKFHGVEVQSYPYALEEMDYVLFLADILYHIDRWVGSEMPYVSPQLHPIKAIQIQSFGPSITNLLAIPRSRLPSSHPLISSVPAADFIAQAVENSQLTKRVPK